MKLLSREDFLAKKTSNTLIVYGSGSSINQLTKHKLRKLRSFDSIGFNWFCKSKIPTTFYLIREQANRPKRVTEGETVEDLFGYMSDAPYIDSCLIVLRLSQQESFPYYDHLDRFPGSGILTNDRKKRGIQHFSEFDVYSNAVCHGKLTLVNILHIAWFFKYEKILFVGIDLYDSKYFWIPEGSTRQSVRKKGRKSTSSHTAKQLTLQIIGRFKKAFPNVEMYTYNPKSALRRIIPVWTFA